MQMGRVEPSPENTALCACGECPSKPEELKTLYCARGQSSRPVTHRGCLCENCEVQLEYDLEGSYYCEGGAA